MKNPKISSFKEKREKNISLSEKNLNSIQVKSKKKHEEKVKFRSLIKGIEQYSIEI